ncbi:hypothetical protein HM1_0305 [Heliomicrobium modesticaldum Ice1]|uniref:Uncharacterized protein n=1 Tax=Heliobacterium modesticaldum (strain ATCC 51547 / Ice1) TaxID=498761 RepID=B0TEK5_HELMI|nr:hypothetical protein HM1_0305 [Heliomicrobium modesticaldum Ice1]
MPVFFLWHYFILLKFFCNYILKSQIFYGEAGHKQARYFYG